MRRNQGSEKKEKRKGKKKREIYAEKSLRFRAQIRDEKVYAAKVEGGEQPSERAESDKNAESQFRRHP